MAKGERGRQKGEQQHLPGTAPKKHPVIHPIAVEYVRLRDKRMDYLKQEVETKTRLLDAMKKAELMGYEYDDINVVRSHTDDVKVKRKKEEE